MVVVGRVDVVVMVVVGRVDVVVMVVVGVVDVVVMVVVGSVDGDGVEPAVVIEDMAKIIRLLPTKCSTLQSATGYSNYT